MFLFHPRRRIERIHNHIEPSQILHLHIENVPLHNGYLFVLKLGGIPDDGGHLVSPGMRFFQNQPALSACCSDDSDLH
ncbi:hypothetical protein SDC9_200809 [bioreactor metagenome]|uniref:Uncharacterized protein n=1 Tax=bioreactor metagenome TaxID=1076179 RepID=A0A645IP83_9ZZZZ